MLKKEKQLNIVKSDSGFSLIEVVVSLLILGIIMVPLLNMFVLSAETGAMSSREQAVNNVASNLMEEIKAQGIQRFIEGRGLDFTQGHWDLSNQGQGNFRYDVSVNSSPVVRSTSEGILWNEFQMPDVAKLNKATTAIIDPFGIFVDYDYVGGNRIPKLVDTYDDLVVLEFYNSHREEIFKHWSAYVEELEPDEETPPAPRSYSMEEIRRKISREICIEVEAGSEKPEEAIVTCYIRYRLLCDMEYHYGLNLSELPYNKPWVSETHDRDFGGFYEQTEFPALQDIYLFHTPLPGGAGTWRNDSIVLKDNRRNPGAQQRLFIVPQLYDMSAGIGTDIQISPKEAWEVYALRKGPVYDEKNKYLLNNSRPIPTYAVQDSIIKVRENTLVEKLEAEDRLYNITVTIKEQETGKSLLEMTVEGR